MIFLVFFLFFLTVIHTIIGKVQLLQLMIIILVEKNFGIDLFYNSLLTASILSGISVIACFGELYVRRNN